MTPDHSDQPVLEEELGNPEQALILLHGRGATAESIMQLGRATAEDALLLAPQAASSEWYPASFLEPQEANQPWLDAALDRVAAMLERANEQGFSRESCTIVGFSQGGCLATEYAARNAVELGGVFCFSGGLIGKEVVYNRYNGDMGGTTVFLGCSDSDPYVPEERVHETASVFERLHAEVTTYIEPGMGHTIDEHEQEELAQHLRRI